VLPAASTVVIRRREPSRPRTQGAPIFKKLPIRLTPPCTTCNGPASRTGGVPVGRPPIVPLDKPVPGRLGQSRRRLRCFCAPPPRPRGVMRIAHFKNIGATEDDGMRSVRSRAKDGRICGGEHLIAWGRASISSRPWGARHPDARCERGAPGREAGIFARPGSARADTGLAPAISVGRSSGGGRTPRLRRRSGRTSPVQPARQSPRGAAAARRSSSWEPPRPA